MNAITHSVTIRTKLAKVCDTESSRYAMAAINASPTTGKDNGGAWLTATNGRMMAAVHDPDAVMPSPVLVPSAVAGLTGKSPTRAALNGRWENSLNKLANPLDKESRFPDCSKVVSEVPAGAVAFTLDAGLLLALAQGITEAGDNPIVTMFIPTGETELEKGCVKTGVMVSGKAGIGVIMPCVTEGEDAVKAADAMNKRTAKFAKEFVRANA